MHSPTRTVCTTPAAPSALRRRSSVPAPAAGPASASWSAALCHGDNAEPHPPGCAAQLRRHIRPALPPLHSHRAACKRRQRPVQYMPCAVRTKQHPAGFQRFRAVQPPPQRLPCVQRLRLSRSRPSHRMTPGTGETTWKSAAVYSAPTNTYPGSRCWSSLCHRPRRRISIRWAGARAHTPLRRSAVHTSRSLPVMT